MKYKILNLVAIMVVSAFYAFAQQAESRLLRFPSINKNLVAFSYAGDIYTVPLTGGNAQRLTSHSGYEAFAKISPDGKYIAFTGQYDGNTEVYVIPAEGGIPKRLTYTATLSRDDISDRMGPNNVVMTWTPDSKSIIYRSRCYTFNDFTGQLFKISVDGGMPEELPLSTGGFCSFSPDASKLAMNRIFREFRTWKYYKGGMADDIWIFDFASKQIQNITNNNSQDIFPMWAGEQIFFLSDRDRTMNLFVYNTKTNETKKVSDYDNFDIKFPSIGDNKIIYENGGFLYYYDIATQSTKKISVIINTDLSGGRNELKNAAKFITSDDVSPNGERIVLSARGDIFTVPSKSGVTRNITKSSYAHDKTPTWSPDGKKIAYLSDRSGEFEVYIQKEDGTEEAVQLTKNSDTYIFNLMWSPDSKKIMWADRKFRLRYVDVTSKTVTEVGNSEKWEITNYSWSPDSKWVTYVKSENEGFSKIYIYNLETKKNIPATDGWFDVGNPVFSADGKYLFFTSRRDFSPIYSDTEWNTAYKNMNKIYMILLSKTTANPFAPENNEVGVKQNDTTKNKSTIVKIDEEGLISRTVSLPIKASNYANLSATDERLYYLQRDYNQRDALLKYFDFKKEEEIEVGSGVNFTISANCKKMMVAKNSDYYIIDLPNSGIQLKEKVDLSAMKVIVNYEQEWKQIYNESWRQMRDFFYDPNMHGVNWKKINEKYAVLLPYVYHRDDLTYIIGEMIAELNCGHSYVNSGDKPTFEKIKTGLLGAKFTKHSSGYFQISKLLKGSNWTDKLRSPLTEPGMDVKEGDFILSINGTSTNKLKNIFEALINTANQQVEILVNSKPELAGSRKIIVVPIEDESNLYYLNWVEGNIEKVSKATNGQVGYVHIPDMSAAGLNEFVKYFYPQMDKKALIIDDRGNGGGNVSPMIIERLRRELAYFTIGRNVAYANTQPREMILGPKIMLINEYSASDGDLFPYQFKTYKMGTVIGKRSWGGVVGVRGSLSFIDGGTMQKPENGKYSRDGKSWIIEGYGVDPDIEVENDPYKEYFGQDAQLERAIKEILEQMKTYPFKYEKAPEFENKSK